jgi:LPXTG-site transpeptidase (sortase) family protein
MARLSRPIPAAAWRLPTALVLVLWLGAACSVNPIPNAIAASAVTTPHPMSTGEGPPPSTSLVTAVNDPSASSTMRSLVEPDVDSASAATTSTAPSPIRQGSVAPNGRVRFMPGAIELPSGNSAVVEPERTVNGVLQVPDDIRRVGWWDGSAFAGDPYGATVIAGHVDSKLQGLGFFAELLLMQAGDVITLRSDSQALTYRVVSATLVDKGALASESQALDQNGPHRLVLITCSGQWHPEVRSYDSNLVLVADPVTL